MKERGDHKRSWGDGVQRRHRRYIDSRPSITAANIVIPEVAGMRLGARLGVRLVVKDPLPVSCLSSFRVQPVLAVISAGQATRLNFALRSISTMHCVSDFEVSTWEMMHL